MRKFDFAFGILVLPFVLLSLQSQTSERNTSTVSGRVTLKGEPARNVLVYLQPYNSPPSNPDAYSRARTDENGQFRIAGVAAGGYNVVALAPGFIAPGIPVLEGKALKVSEGEDVENIDFELKQGGVITGRVTDSQGRPLADERVTLGRLDKTGRPQSDNYYGRNFFMFWTDDRGVYRLYGLPEGRYLVSVGAPQSAGMVNDGGTFYPRTFHPDAATESEAKVVEVREGSVNENIDITVPDAKRTRVVSGRVIDAETGKPVPGVEVTWGLVYENGNRVGSWGGWNGDKSRANGEFHLKGMAPGKYAVFPRGDSENKFFGEPVMCDLSEGDASGVEIKVRQGGSISGFVVIEGTNDPTPLAKLPQLSLYVSVRSDQQIATPRMDNPKINADGSFHIFGLPPCRAHIQYYPRPETHGLALARIERNGAPVNDWIKVGAAERITEVRVVLTFRTFALRGEVKIIGGAPPTGASFHVNARRTDRQASSYSSAQVDARGQFVIEGLTTGEYEVTVQPVWYPGADPIGPHIAHFAKAFSSAREKVTINNGDQRVTFVVDLSKKESER
jgi:protocatechuate 3,4-dioxygenase beta subunit